MKTAVKTPYPVKLVYEVIDLEDKHIEFNENLILRRANSEELELFRTTLMTNSHIFPLVRTDANIDIPIYEARYDEEIIDGQIKGYLGKRNKPEKHRYWVFFDLLQENSEEEFDVLKIVLKLLPIELTFSIHYDFIDSFTWNPSELFQNKVDKSILYSKNVPCLGKEHFSNLMPLIDGLIKIKNNYPQLKLPFEIYYSTFLLPSYSKQQLLMFFSALEALITHKPTDSGDSITKQLVNKINLLNNRFDTPIDDKFLKNGISLDKFIKKLYTFRSSIAHGGSFTYDHLIENDYMGCFFVKEILKKCLIQAIKEPRLILDLSKC